MNDLPSTYICFDIETSGLSFDKDHVIEIGYIFVREGVPIKSNSTLIQMPDDKKLDRNITRITGISNLDLAYAGIPLNKDLDLDGSFTTTSGTLTANNLMSRVSLNYIF